MSDLARPAPVPAVSHHAQRQMHELEMRALTIAPRRSILARILKPRHRKGVSE